MKSCESFKVERTPSTKARSPLFEDIIDTVLNSKKRGVGPACRQAGVSPNYLIVSGIPFSVRTSRQRAMASLMFFNASFLVSPWLTQPGIDGHSMIQTPSSSRSLLH
jgi:hypothetical protein